MIPDHDVVVARHAEWQMFIDHLPGPVGHTMWNVLRERAGLAPIEVADVIDLANYRGPVANPDSGFWRSTSP